MIRVLLVTEKDKPNNLFVQMAAENNIEVKTVFGIEGILNKSNYDGIDVFVCSYIGYKYSNEFFAILKEKSIKYFVQTMTGINHVDLDAARKYGVKCANVRAYSPNAIAEYTLGMILSMNRNLFEFQDNNKDLNFKRLNPFKEIRECTIGIIGVGAIGIKTAQYFKAMKAKVIGYDPYPNEKNKETIEYCELDYLRRNSDIIILHLPYIPNKNYHMIDEKFLSELKQDCILVNSARGELVDLAAINKAIKDNKLWKYGCDVLENEDRFFHKDFSSIEEINDEVIKESLSLYPRILITPHVAANTYLAKRNQILIAYKMINSLYKTGSCEYLLV